MAQPDEIDEIEVDETAPNEQNERDLEETQQADGIADIETADEAELDTDMGAEIETDLDGDGGTDRAATPELEGQTPLPEELTGRASGTDEDLVALFDNGTDKHMTDGFRGGATDEPPVDDDEMLNDAAQGSP
ncbi:MAG TPA: hypothetical protein VE861_06335 [Gemmatimonadaceae bacterium]|nr:hypothetical protein [Gemmatimonadaceae bacterium]